MVDGSSLDDEDREVKKRIKQEGGEEGKEEGKEEEEEKERGRERERIVGGLDLQGSKAFLSLSHPQGSTGFRLSPGKGITTKVPQRFLPVYLTSPQPVSLIPHITDLLFYLSISQNSQLFSSYISQYANNFYKSFRRLNSQRSLTSLQRPLTLSV